MLIMENKEIMKKGTCSCPAGVKMGMKIAKLVLQLLGVMATVCIAKQIHGVKKELEKEC